MIWMLMLNSAVIQKRYRDQEHLVRHRIIPEAQRRVRRLPTIDLHPNR